MIYIYILQVIKLFIYCKLNFCFQRSAQILVEESLFGFECELLDAIFILKLQAKLHLFVISKRGLSLIYFNYRKITCINFG